jgi:hypothetical protein
MKTNYFLFLISFLFSLSALSQQNNNSKRNDNIAVDLLMFQSPVINRNFYGFSADFKYYLKDKWGTGLNFAIANKRINLDYSYDLVEPDITYLSVGWLNQYDIVQNEKVRVGVNLNNGIAFFNLRDRTQTELVWDEFEGHTEVPIVQARNVFYVIEPGITASFLLFTPKNFSPIYLTTQAKYRQAIGNPKFAQANDYSNYFLGVGISIIGPFD